MWAIAKFEKKNLEFLKKNLKKKLGNDVKFYLPKIFIKKYKKNKLTGCEINLLGDYLFFFHKNLIKNENLITLRFTKGLKYFLDGFISSQIEIDKFINYCKKFENQNGYLSSEFLNLSVNKNYRVISGPFTKKIFKIISLQKNRINVLLGNLETSFKKGDFFFSPIL